nr:uncharacterized protein LOC108389706 isoform X7 [Manis javanica]
MEGHAGPSALVWPHEEVLHWTAGRGRGPLERQRRKSQSITNCHRVWTWQSVHQYPTSGLRRGCRTSEEGPSCCTGILQFSKRRSPLPLPEHQLTVWTLARRTVTVQTKRPLTFRLQLRPKMRPLLEKPGAASSGPWERTHGTAVGRQHMALGHLSAPCCEGTQDRTGETGSKKCLWRNRTTGL